MRCCNLEKLGFPVKGDGQFHTYVVDLQSSPDYRGNITGLRFDPILTGAPGEYVEVAYISHRDYEAEEQQRRREGRGP